jgi:hypothetical protein
LIRRGRRLGTGALVIALLLLLGIGIVGGVLVEVMSWGVGRDVLDVHLHVLLVVVVLLFFFFAVGGSERMGG